MKDLFQGESLTKRFINIASLMDIYTGAFRKYDAQIREKNNFYRHKPICIVKKSDLFSDMTIVKYVTRFILYTIMDIKYLIASCVYLQNQSQLQ